MHHCLYVEIDAVLDTRLGVIALHSGEAAVELIDNKYQMRLTDELWRYSNSAVAKQFAELYASREMSCLPLSRPTGVLAIIGEIVANINIDKPPKAPFDTISIELNTYPYTLSEDEANAFTECMRIWIDADVLITPIYRPYEFLNTDGIARAGYTSMFVYNFEAWVEAVVSKLTELPIIRCPAVTMYIPQIARSEESLKEGLEIRNDNGQSVDPFQVVRATFAELISLEYISAQYFSIAPLTAIMPA